MENNTESTKVENNILLLLKTNDQEILKVTESGDFYVKEKLVQNDKEVVDAFREFLVKQGVLSQKEATHGEFCFDELNSIIKVAEKLYYEANPGTKMDVPSSVYETVEKWALSWMNRPENLTLYAWIKKYKS